METGALLIDASWVTRSPARRGPAPSAIMKGPPGARTSDVATKPGPSVYRMTGLRTRASRAQLCLRLTVAEVGFVDARVSETKIGFR